MVYNISENKKTIVVIESEEELHDIFETLFKREGFDYKKIVTGLEAVNFIDENRNNRNIALYIFDHILPDINSLHIVKKIDKNFPILLLTRLRSKKQLKEDFLHYEDAYLTLPINPRELIQKAKSLLGNKVE